MNKSFKKGKFIVVEGVNGAGKTTVLNQLLPDLSNEEYKYNKGFTLNSRWDRLINSHPHSFTYFLDIAWKTQKQIKPLLRNGKNVIQDRYIQSIDSYLPDCNRIYNQIFRGLMHPAFVRPDLYIHFRAETGVIVERLKNDARDNYRTDLAYCPERIEQREQKYLEIYNKLNCPKYILDTSKKSINDSVNELTEIIRRELKCL